MNKRRRKKARRWLERREECLRAMSEASHAYMQAMLENIMDTSPLYQLLQNEYYAKPLGLKISQ